MYCILVTGIPASGKSTMAEFLAEKLRLPVISKDKVKEILFDDVGFSSRSDKVALGTAAMNIMYYTAQQMMKCGQSFILENNFENVSQESLLALLQKYSYTAVTVVLTGDYEVIYQRFLARNESPDRHRGHVVNDCYPEKEGLSRPVPVLSFENFCDGIKARGMDKFNANGPCIVVDTTNFSHVDKEALLRKICGYVHRS
ncbi:AAA family ATPase [Eisenbergiella sp.]